MLVANQRSSADVIADNQQPTKLPTTTDGTLDFYQIHTYPNNGDFSPSSPLRIPASELQLDKPVVIGEFAARQCTAQGCDVKTLYRKAADTGYSGVWDWSLAASDSQDNEAIALQGQFVRAFLRHVCVCVILSPFGMFGATAFP